MEEASVAAASEEGGGTNSGISGRSLEAQQSVAGEVAVQGSGQPLGPLRSHAPEAQQPRGLWHDAMPQRGLMQKLKHGVQSALAVTNLVQDIANQEEKFIVLEVFAGTARLTKMAKEDPDGVWTALESFDVLSGQDLLKRDEQKKLWDVIYKHEPDLITLAMPCGPWCSWMYLCDPDKVAEKRAEDLPLWRLARKVWDHQVRMKRLVLTEQPLGSEALRLTFMQERPKLYRVKLAQCMFGSADAVSGKPHRKLTALDVNDQYFADQLSLGSVCMHHPDEHQPLEGKVQVDGKWVNRSALAAAWPLPLCKHILKSAEKTLTRVQEIPPWHLARENEADDTMWETMPVASGQVPEQQLRKTLADLGATADRYGFVTFEGAGQQAPRRIRAAVAHLHVTLGHVANDRLVRMLTLSGAGNQILTVASNLRCQICAMVHPPRDAPQVSGNRPQNFNEKLSGDTFYVWDITNDKFAVLHYVDGLTDYQVADCSIDTNSIVAAELLRNCWYSIFGTPDVLVTDGGTEFSGAVQSPNELMGVIHEVVPEGAKWRLGHAERHGAILKLMIMKMVKSHNLKGYTEMRLAVTAAVMAKNRLANNGGVSPLQAVTGRNNVIPSSLMNQICSGKMRYVLNHAISRDECVQRAERIRAAAVESYRLDSHDALRKALASKSRPPKLELIREGATVYIYDPPASRRGLARRLQDNSSWSGPGTVVCVERDKNVPTRVWVRIRSKVKGGFGKDSTGHRRGDLQQSIRHGGIGRGAEGTHVGEAPSHSGFSGRRARGTADGLGGCEARGRR